MSLARPNFLPLNRELISNSMDSAEIKAFLQHLLQQGLIDYVKIEELNEKQSQRGKVDLLIRMCMMDAKVTEEFLKWMQENKNELYNAISPPDAEDISLQVVASDDDSESETETLSKNSKDLITLTPVFPEKEFVDKIVADVDNVYRMTSPKRGVALIIINRSFKSFKSREGSLVDQRHLTELFNWLGYNVRVHSDVTKDQMINLLHKCTREQHEEQRKFGSFVLCVLSYSKGDYVITQDEDYIHRQDILDTLDSNNFPAMAGKPKFIFFDLMDNKMLNDNPDDGFPIVENLRKLETEPQQPILIVKGNDSFEDMRAAADSGVRIGDQSANIDKRKVACKSDFIICFSAFYRYSGLHSNRMGSLATRLLLEVFYKHAHNTHITDLILRMRRKMLPISIAGKKQVIVSVDTLTKHFYIFPPV